MHSPARSLLAIAGCVLAGTFARAELTPAQPENFFVEPGQTASLAWNTTDALDQVAYRITDYAGREVADGTASAQANARLEIPVTLSRGYYEISVAGQTFGVVAQDAFTRSPDPFFGMDAVITWLERRPEMRLSLLKIMKRAGVGMSRERLRWIGVNPRPNVWDWQEMDRADDLRALYRQVGIPVLEMFHDPGPARGDFSVTTRYPQDLVQLSRSWPVIHERWQDTWGAFEVWNEPDGRSYGQGLPADQYMPLVKAMRWAFQHAGITAPLGGGVLIGSDPGDFHAILSANGLTDAVDFVSFHDYRPALELEGLVAHYRDWMKRSGREDMPLWLTEVGFPWNTGPGRAPIREDEASAMEIAMKGVEARACGIVRFMPFCLPFYEERGVKTFSLLGREVTPLRSFAAYAQSIRALAGREYLGDLRLPDAAVKRARVFGPVAGSAEADCVVVLFTGTADDTRVRLPFAPHAAESIDGRALDVGDDHVLTITGGIAYLGTSPAAISGLIERDTRAAALLAASRLPAPAALQASPVVLQHIVDPGQITYSPACYLIDASAIGRLTIAVRAVNLADHPAQARLGLRLPGESAAPDSRLQTVTIPAQSSANTEWTVDATDHIDIADTRPVIVEGFTADKQPVGALAIPMRAEGTLEGFRRHFPNAAEVPIADLGRWEKNITTHGTMNLSAQDAGGWRLDVSFKRAGERWVYPKFKLPRGLLPGADGLVLRLRAKHKAELRLMMFGTGKSGSWTSIPIAPADGRWHVAYVPFDQFETLPGHAAPADLGQMVSLAIGMHDSSAELENTLDVSDVIVVGR